MKNKKTVFILILLFFVFMFLRFYNIEERIIFDWDQEQFSYQIKNIVENKDFTLLGPRANNDRGFFLGPYFTYLLVPFYMFRNLHPIALIDFMVIYNVAFFTLTFFVISKLFSQKHAFLFLSFWALNPLLALYDALPWWSLLLPLGIITIWYLLNRIYKKPNYINFVFLGLALGLFINIRIEFIFLIVFSLFFLLWKSEIRKNLNLKNIFSFVSSFIFMFLPLIVFDMRHNFLNSNLFFKFFFSSTESSVGRDYLSWIPVASNFFQPLTYIKNDSLTIIVFLLLGFLSIFLIRKRTGFQKLFYQSFLVVLIITPLFFSFYGKRPSEYYFAYLYPFIALIFSDFLLSLKNKYLALLILTLFIFINVRQLNDNFKTNPLGLYFKNLTAKKIKENVDLSKKINITMDTPLGRNNGFNYLIDWYGIEQSGNYDDALVQIKIPSTGTDVKINDEIGLLIPKNVRK